MAPQIQQRQEAARYANVDQEDRDDRSSTEVESLMEMDKQWGLEDQAQGSVRRSRASRVCAAFNAWRWLIDTTLLVAILVVLLRMQRSSAATDEVELSGDMTGFSPRCAFLIPSLPHRFATSPANDVLFAVSKKIVKFEPEDDYAPYNISEFFNPEVLDRWNKLMPKGIGFQEVPDPSKYHDLPTPIVWDEGHTVFTTSWTHQLHCLWAVVQTYAGLKSNVSLPADHHWHMIHCFSYMRQAILCNADMALEGKETTFPDHNGGSDGWDSVRIDRLIGEARVRANERNSTTFAGISTRSEPTWRASGHTTTSRYTRMLRGNWG
jgi:hypothetical protein